MPLFSQMCGRKTGKEALDSICDSVHNDAHTEAAGLGEAAAKEP